MKAHRRQRTNGKLHARASARGRYPAPCASSLGPFFNEKPVARSQEGETSDQRPATGSGFTLLEVMVAMAIMAIVLVSVYRMHSQTLTMNSANRFYTQAPLLAQAKLAQLNADPSETIAGGSGDFGEEFPGYSWNLTMEDVSSAALGEAADDLKRIDLMVSFNSDEYTYSVRTYRLIRD